MTITNNQFNALVALTSVRSAPIIEGARLVLVEGKKTTEAANQAGVRRQNVSRVVRILRGALAWARIAAGVESAPS